MARRGSVIEIAAAACVAIVVLAALALTSARSRPEAAPTATSAPTTAVPTPPPTPEPSARTIGGPIGAIMTTRTVVVRTKPSNGAPSTSQIRAGILLPVLARAGSFVQVMTPCERTGYVPLASTDAFAVEAHPAKTLKQATIVIDPGHGGTESGATGPHGLEEKTVNLDIAERLAGQLKGARVFITRSGDYNAGLGFRAAIANGLHADAFVSVHNNANPNMRSSKPGTETYYQVASGHSKRLAGLAFEELVPALERFKVAWVSYQGGGSTYRTSTSGLDYYGVLRHSKVPAIISESLFITSAPEEALLSQPAGRQAIAAALGRAIDRYITTSAPGSGFVRPLTRNDGPAFALPTNCHDPS